MYIYYDLMEGEQRGAKEKCSGTTKSLLIDRMVCQDSQRGATEHQHGLDRRTQSV